MVEIFNNRQGWVAKVWSHEADIVRGGDPIGSSNEQVNGQVDFCPVVEGGILAVIDLEKLIYYEKDIKNWKVF